MPLTLYAPMRDGDLNDAMVGLFSDWRVRIPSFWYKLGQNWNGTPWHRWGIYIGRVFLEVVWSNAFSMDEAMNDSRISPYLAARWSVCLGPWGQLRFCGCGRWGSHATFPSQAWNVLWSGRVWCSLQDHSTPSDALCKLRRFNQENWVDTANQKNLSLPVSLQRNFFLQVCFEICSCM